MAAAAPWPKGFLQAQTPASPWPPPACVAARMVREDFLSASDSLVPDSPEAKFRHQPGRGRAQLAQWRSRWALPAGAQTFQASEIQLDQRLQSSAPAPAPGVPAGGLGAVEPMDCSVSGMHGEQPHQTAPGPAGPSIVRWQHVGLISHRGVAAGLSARARPDRLVSDAHCGGILRAERSGLKRRRRSYHAERTTANVGADGGGGTFHYLDRRSQFWHLECGRACRALPPRCSGANDPGAGQQTGGGPAAGLRRRPASAVAAQPP